MGISILHNFLITAYFNFSIEFTIMHGGFIFITVMGNTGGGGGSGGSDGGGGGGGGSGGGSSGSGGSGGSGSSGRRAFEESDVVITHIYTVHVGSNMGAGDDEGGVPYGRYR